MADKKKLGRGLSALLGESADDYAKLDRARGHKPVPVELLHPGRYQPRHFVDQEAIEALAVSIREKGVLQPLLVRRHPDDPAAYEIIAGERRWRAAQLAQLHEVPVIIKEFDDQTTMEVAVVENVQREDLSAIEEAEAYQRLVEEFDYTQEDLSALVGKSRSHIANTLRLLALDDKVRKLIEEGLLSAGHARTLIGVEGAYDKARLIIEKGLSVREAEQLARQSSAKAAGGAPKPGKDVDTIALERDLSNLLGVKVSIDGSGQKGSLKLAFSSLDQLDLLIRKLRMDIGGTDDEDTGPAHVAPAPRPQAAPEPEPAKETPKLSVSLKPKVVGKS